MFRIGQLFVFLSFVFLCLRPGVILKYIYNFLMRNFILSSDSLYYSH